MLVEVVFFELKKYIVNIIKIKINKVTNVCPAPKPIPIAIEKNKYINSSGSFIGVLNRTIDNAPIKPRDKAKDDFTIKIIRKVI